MVTRAIVCALVAAWALPLAAQDGFDEIVRGDFAAAAALLRPRAESGDANAMVGLAYVATLEGRDADAARWYFGAARRGHADARVLLASAYLEGRGVARDPRRAYAWYHLAAEQGHANAARARDFAGRWLTPEEQAEARALARRWQVDAMPEAP